jgi:hypothetical protein
VGENDNDDDADFLAVTSTDRGCGGWSSPCFRLRALSMLLLVLVLVDDDFIFSLSMTALPRGKMELTTKTAGNEVDR